MTTVLSARTFPPGFAWGVSVGAHQTEGGNVASDWWHRENEPGTSVAERCGDAVDSYHRWREDFDLAAGAGFTDYRFGIERSRIEPADGFVSLAALDHYRRMVEGAVERGLRPTVTLHHFTVPLWFAAGGGWTGRNATERFLRYIDALQPVLDAGVERIMTINEPNILAVFPKLTASGQLASGLPEPDAGLTGILIDVHRAAVARIRERHPRIPVGWGVSVQDYRAAPGAETARDAYAESRDAVFLRASAGDDFVGVQAYTGGVVGVDGEPVLVGDVPRTLTGWEFLPDALGGAVRRVSRLLPGVPIVVTENGVAVSEDRRRIQYTTGALASLRRAMDDGADVRGYFHWSLLDNWEWGHWEPTFGLVSVDRATFERTPKPSLAWLGSLAPPAVPIDS
ncbi:family 1 glycosylhydrolase [Leifsonia sp. NPDC077715]|uniref:glycoside hydrolase family 1 protein n=1 Tax=Leifsonia sp. NPDC077715 TaxID=3155539 RepID=UPI003432AC93